ncbi:hypothetical protein [Xanthomonas indica]|uniref:Uncharacterized protein n=1 Tax=Xanthomonas indica TaxID=2912242 RepID=A0AAU8I7Z4_9XANT|nr:hypothetical protein [Xanthomonas indica]MCI2262193.1 hypothetical protein [Xanthomonas indica]
MIETEEFTILEAEAKHSPANGLSGRGLQWVGIRSVSADCKKCDYSWYAFSGDGTLDMPVGAALLTCPHCRNHGQLPMRELKALSEGAA